MLQITVFNVGKGSSVLVNLGDHGDKIRVGIIDCYAGPGHSHPLLRALRALRRKKSVEIAFFVVTHLHADHFVGVSDLLDEFGGAVVRFADPGLDLRAVLVAEFGSDGHRDRTKRQETWRMIDYKDHATDVCSLVAPGVEIYRDANTVVTTVAPPGDLLHRMSRFLQRHFQRMSAEVKRGVNVKETSSHAPSYDLNKTSSAIEIAYDGHRIIFGGDVLASVWQRMIERGTLRPADVVVMSHHGATNGFPSAFAKMLSHGAKLLISGDGEKHPSKAVLSGVAAIDMCGGVWATNIPSHARVEPFVLQQHFGGTSAGSTSGDITCVVDKSGIQVSGPRIM